MYFVKWQIRVLQIHRLERMMMLQENSRLADLRLVAFFFDHRVIDNTFPSLKSCPQSCRASSESQDASVLDELNFPR